MDTKDGDEIIDKLQKFLQLRYQNDIELHVKEKEKKRYSDRKKSGYYSAVLGHSKNEILAGLKRVKYKDLYEKPMRTFSFSPPINVSDGVRWLLGVSAFEPTLSVSTLTVENNSFSITTPNYFFLRGQKAIKKIRETLGLRQKKHIELHVKKVKRQGNQIKIGDKE